MCVCVCVCVCEEEERGTKEGVGEYHNNVLISTINAKLEVKRLIVHTPQLRAAIII